MVDVAPRPGDLHANWYALYVQVRHEKAIGMLLELRGITCYVPLIDSVRKWSDRRTVVAMPLFPGYVFVKIALEECVRILHIRGVVSFVAIGNTPSPIPEQEILALQNALTYRESAVVPYFPVDTRVRILSGPLTGLQGVVVREKGKSRMIVCMDLIKRAVSVELDPLDLQKIQ